MAERPEVTADNANRAQSAIEAAARDLIKRWCAAVDLMDDDGHIPLDEWNDWMAAHRRLVVELHPIARGPIERG